MVKLAKHHSRMNPTVRFPLDRKRSLFLIYRLLLSPSIIGVSIRGISIFLHRQTGMAQSTLNYYKLVAFSVFLKSC